MDNQNPTVSVIQQGQIPPGTIKQRHLAASTEIANGDLYYGDGDNNFTRLPVGTNGQVLTVTDGIPVYATPASGVPTAITADSITSESSHDLALIADTANTKVVTTTIVRQGGSSTNWNTAGTTTYATSGAFMQAGVISMNGWNSGGGAASVTFPVAFSNTPLIFVQYYDNDSSHFGMAIIVRQASTTGFTMVNNGTTATTDSCQWLAIGPR